MLSFGSQWSTKQDKHRHEADERLAMRIKLFMKHCWRFHQIYLLMVRRRENITIE